MPKEQLVELPGVVSDVLPNATYRIKLDGGQDIVAVVGTAGQEAIPRLACGDAVLVEVKPYDLSRGRIILRLL